MDIMVEILRTPPPRVKEKDFGGSSILSLIIISLVAVVLLVLSVVLLLLVLLARIDTARALRQRAGGAYTLVRAVCKMGEPPLVPVFVFAIVSVPLSAVCAYAFQSIVPPLDGADFAMQVLVGVFAFAGQWLMSQSLKMERAGRATSITYVKVLGTYALGVGILGEEPTLLGAGGALLVVMSAAIVVAEGGAAGG